MASIRELIAGIEVEQEAAEKREARARKEIEVILAGAQQDGRSGLTEEEDSKCEVLFAAIEEARKQQDGIARKLANAKRVEAEEAETEARLKDLHATPAAAKRNATSTREVVHVTREERTYNPGIDPSGRQFLMDVARSFAFQDPGANMRLARHMQEERVERQGQVWQERTSNGVGTGAFSGLVVPQYLLDLVAPAVANLRPLADIANRHPLPATGMSVNISRITTASSAALQANEVTDAVSMTDMDDDLLTPTIQTAAGSQKVSRQALERGSGIEDVVIQDIIARMNTVLDATILTQTTHGLETVAHDNNWTEGSPTAAKLYPKIVGAASQVTTAMIGYGYATHVIMHPRRWFWMQSELTSTWPAFGSGAVDPHNLGKATGNQYNEGVVAVLPCGLGVVMDANIPTNKGGGTEDEVFVLPWRELHLWEDAGDPVFIRAEQPAADHLAVLLVAYKYFAYTAERYALAFQMVSDTGLIAPAGF